MGAWVGWYRGNPIVAVVLAAVFDLAQVKSGLGGQSRARAERKSDSRRISDSTTGVCPGWYST